MKVKTKNKITGFLLIALAFLIAAELVNRYSKPVEPLDGIGAITTILGTDRLTDSRVTINNNFTDLDTTKMEMATTSVDSITTLSNLATIGTITSGVWNGTAIPVGYGGTGTTSPSTYLTMIGDGANGFTVASTTGTSGQFWTSGGAGAYPSWTTSAISTSDNYAWTGTHNFLSTALFTALNASSTVIFNGVTYNYPSALGASSTVPKIDGSGSITWNPDIKDNYEVWAWAGDGFTNGSVSREADPGFATNDFANSVTDEWTLSAEVPEGADSISSIEVAYRRGNTGNLYLKFSTLHFDFTVGDSRTDDTSDTASTYAGGAADATLGIITVPSGAYDGITVTEDDIISLEIERQAGDANDTYEATWAVYGVKFTFTNSAS